MAASRVKMVNGDIIMNVWAIINIPHYLKSVK